ncbi:MAG TPA: ATP-binding protein [Polyangiaceae bacterium]|nr:ATP-binding protein [Polyangiaceae bacterium]
MIRRVAITGGPGAGKSTVAARLGRELSGRVVVVPEVATHLLGGFFPRIADAEERRAVQRAIYQVQLELESVHRKRAGEETVLLFDRGILDGAAYWPDGCDAFFDAVCGDPASARARYDAVVFLETAAAGGLSINGEGAQSQNLARTEGQAEAVRIDGLLRQVWSPHTSFHFVGYSASFEQKVDAALEQLRRLIPAV